MKTFTFKVKMSHDKQVWRKVEVLGTRLWTICTRSFRRLIASTPTTCTPTS